MRIFFKYKANNNFYEIYLQYLIFFASATLFYIVKDKEKPRIGITLKRRIITALLDGMEAHLGDDTMMRNGCLTLCQFKIPTDVVSIFKNNYFLSSAVGIGASI